VYGAPGAREEGGDVSRTRLGGRAVPLSMASRAGSSAVENEEIRGLSLPKRGDLCACRKVFDGACRAMGEGGWRSIVAFGSRYGAFAGYGLGWPMEVYRSWNARAHPDVVTTSMAGTGWGVACVGARGRSIDGLQESRAMS
jgi:hypothetical protein